MKEIDLGQHLDSDRMSFSGDARGREVRRTLGLDEYDEMDEQVLVRIPARIRAITVSFFQGLFEDSIDTLGLEGFQKHYRFEGEALERTYQRVVEYASRKGSPL